VDQPSPGRSRAPGRPSLLTGVSRNVVVLGLVSFFNDLSSEMICNLLGIFLRMVLHTSMIYVGLIEGIVRATASVLRPASGWLSDRLRVRKPGILVGYWVAACARPLLAISGAAWHVLGLRFADRLGKGVRAAPRDALIADSTERAYRGKAFGLQRAMDNAGAAAGLLVAACVLYLVSGGLGVKLRTLFWIASIPGIAVIALVVWGVREPPKPQRPGPPKAGAPEALGAVVEPHLLKWYLVVFIFWLGNSADGFLLLKAASVLKMPIWQVPLLAFVMSVVTSLFSIRAGTLSDRMGRRRVIIYGWTL